MKKTRFSAPKIALSALAAAALTLAAVAPSDAETPAPSAPVGQPISYLIENQHAAGKMLEIGSPAAQQTGPDNAWKAAAAIFSVAADSAIAQQAVVAYPVTGASNTYVLTNTRGEVLARRANDADRYRYLELRDITPEEAAADPYATWVVVSEGGGWVSIRNTKLDGNGKIPALDMYNWLTADGSEIQTYDLSSAAVQRWKLHATTGVASAVTLTGEQGQVPALPTTVPARYGWGRSFPMTPVSWQLPDPAVWQTPGSVTVPGTATGLFGESVSFSAVVSLPGDAVDGSLAAYVGQSLKDLQMRAPRTVERTLGNTGLTVTAPVTWDWSAVNADATAQPGTFRVPAVAGAFAASLVVTVAPAQRTNLLPALGKHYTYTFKDGTPFALTDGVRDVMGFGDWRSGGAGNRVNPNTVTFLFEQPVTVNGAAVFDVGGPKNLPNIGTVTIQYRTLTSGWVDLPAHEITWPYQNPTDKLSLTVDSDTVTATGLRVIVTNKSTSTWMSLSEIELYGPTVGSVG